MKIGNIDLKNNVVLGPMAGFTDRAFRLICEKYNPGLVVTEMVSAKGLFYKDEKTKILMNHEGEKVPVAIQIFGSDEEAMAYSAKYISENKLGDIIDINMGCPVPKVVKNGDGSKLLLDLDKIKKIVQAVVNNSSIPVTAKIRKGWDNEHIVAVEAAKVIEDSGASAITIHGRTRSEFYSGNADWNIIRQVKENVNIPVIGNGDVKSPEDVKKILEETQCDGVMIARGSLGNPWIFKQAQEYLQKGRYAQITKEEKLKTIIEHIKLEVDEKGEERGIREMRKHMGFYIKGETNASKIRNEINHIENQKELEKVLSEFYEI